MTSGRQIVGLVGSLVVAFTAAAIGAIASVRAADFYLHLNRPSWAPPANVFGPVWSVLYLLMAIAAWLVWRQQRGRDALVIYGIQLGLNALWSWLFFAWHQGLWAFVEVVVLWLFIAATVVSFWRVSKAAAALLLPYLLWVSFASVLAYNVWRMNPSQLG